MRGRAITGLVYQALPMGAVPIAHESIIDLRGVPCEEMAVGEGTAYCFRETADRDYKYLDDSDKMILDRVIDCFGKMTKDEIVSYMHMETAYQKTTVKDIILFKYAENLRLGLSSGDIVLK